MSKTIKGYIYNSVSYEQDVKTYENDRLIESNTYNFVDLFYIDLTKDITNENYRNAYSCLRIYNFRVDFYLCKLPGKTNTEFKNFCKNSLKNIKNISYDFTTEYNGKPLKDSMFFSFNNPMLYCVVWSLSSSNLNRAYKKLKKDVEEYYNDKLKRKIENNELNEWDRVFYNNTETPFRFDMTTLNANNVRYHLSTKYNIPCVGGFEFKCSSSDIEYYEKISKEHIPGLIINDGRSTDIKTPKLKNTAKNTIIYNVQEDNNKLFKIKHDEEINGQNHLTLLSYDIETYDSDKDLTEDEKYIMCIGVGLFNITDDKPFKRWCISSRDLTEHDRETLKNNGKLINIENKKDGSKQYTISNEYSDKEEDKEQDTTIYIIVKSEYEILLKFISLINNYKPIFITGFNNYGFDDRRINNRLAYYDNIKKNNMLNNAMFSSLNYYELDGKDEKELKRIKRSISTFSKFSIKIDGEQYNDNMTWTGETSSVFTDTYKIMLASNAKLYTQQGRGNLDTMLEVNGIKNPFNGNNLKKSGLSYVQMWYNWDHDENIYDILLYCCQDAWITGTLLIKSCQLIDKIEMSTLSCTTISDSVYKAVTWRVKHLVERYAWDNNFAVADSVDNKEDKNGKHIPRSDNHVLGNKRFDTRTIVGGEVKSIAHGRQKYIIALDFSAMYPSQKEGSNIDTSTFIDKDIINNPSLYGLKEYHKKVEINDMYKKRSIYYFEKINKNEYFAQNSSDNEEEYEEEQKEHDKQTEHETEQKEHGERFIIETFRSEFKNDKQAIEKNLQAMVANMKNIKESEKQGNEIELEKQENIKEELIKELAKLYPSYYVDIANNIYDKHKEDITKYTKDITPTEIKQLYVVQSPRDDKNIVSLHYSLKEKMLSDLRALRSKVKKQMENATDSLSKNRYNSKQLAIKVMCNSEYGASNSPYFPYYDTLIGGATTAASRCLINFLTTTLEATKLYVSKRFIDANINYINELAKYKVLSYEPFKMDNYKSLNEFMKKNRRYSLRELYNEYYDVITTDIYVINIEPSRVVYQDTDSNYYTNDYIRTILTPDDKHKNNSLQNYYCKYDLNNTDEKELLKETPAIINMKMNLLLNHNNLFGNFIKDSILRKPISVGFEGAFIIARYFNVKKKYYGVVWNDGMKSYLNDECYDINNKYPIESINNKILKYDYDITLSDGSKAWNPAKTSYPLPNGDYIRVDMEKLLHSNTDKLKYIKSQNVKCTGVDLARRDQYKFINANHIRLIQNDLHFLKYLGFNKWEDVSNVNMYDVVMNLLQEFNKQLSHINNIVNCMLENKEYDYDISTLYNLSDYAKDITFKYIKVNKLHCLDDGYTDNYYNIKDINGKDSEVIITESGELLKLTYNNETGLYSFIKSEAKPARSSEISNEIQPKFEMFAIEKTHDENDGDKWRILKNKMQKFEIIYDSVEYEKKNKILTTIGQRLYDKITELKFKLQRRLTDQEFNEIFPQSFSRKQYVIMLTDEVKKDRAKATKTENVKNADKAFLIEELHKDYKDKLTEEQYDKLTFHEKIPYEQFIDIQIINDVDYIHYIEAFCSAVSLYLIEYSYEITKNKAYEPLTKTIFEEDEDKNDNSELIKKAKAEITWNLLIKIRPERNLRKNKQKYIKPDVKMTDYEKQKAYEDIKDNANMIINKREITEEDIIEFNNISKDDYLKLINVYEFDNIQILQKKYIRQIKNIFADMLEYKTDEDIDAEYSALTKKEIKEEKVANNERIFNNFITRIRFLNIEIREKYEKCYAKLNAMHEVEHFRDIKMIDNQTCKSVSKDGLKYFNEYFENRTKETIKKFNDCFNELSEKVEIYEKGKKLINKIMSDELFKEFINKA